MTSLGESRTTQTLSLINGGDYEGAIITTPPDNDDWAHFALVRDGSGLTLYLNGVSFGPLAVTGTWSEQETFYLFATVFGGPSPVIADDAGQLANIAMFDRALTGDEVSALAAAGRDFNAHLSDGGDWAGEVPVVHWRDVDAAGLVSNAGDGGSCDLSLVGAVESIAPTSTSHPISYPPIVIEAQVESEFAGWDGNVREGLVSEWAIPDLNNPDSIEWDVSVSEEGRAEFFDGVRSGSITFTASEMAGGRAGTLDLKARGRGMPRAEGETDISLRRRYRSAPDMVTPEGVERAVNKALGFEGVVALEYWDVGFAFGVSGFGEAPFSDGRTVVVVIPSGEDVAVIQRLVDRIRPAGIPVLVLEEAP
jgi:hypothetical protein